MQQGDPRPDATVLKFPRTPSLYDKLAERHLQWFPELGVGYYPVSGSPYDQQYFDRFARQADTPIGRKLMKQRVAFVGQHYRGTLVDVGIGSGAFIEARDDTYGFDINPAGVAWLKKRCLWFNPYDRPVAAISMWDVLEHMPDSRPLLANVEEWLFLAVPLFDDAEHVLRSKHYRKDEHFWYWTRRGLVTDAGELGFKSLSESNMETSMPDEKTSAPSPSNASEQTIVFGIVRKSLEATVIHACPKCGKPGVKDQKTGRRYLSLVRRPTTARPRVGRTVGVDAEMAMEYGAGGEMVRGENGQFIPVVRSRFSPAISLRRRFPIKGLLLMGRRPQPHTIYRQDHPERTSQNQVIAAAAASSAITSLT